MFETTDKKSSTLPDDIKTIKINGRRTISQISIYWFHNHINGLRIKDDKGVYLVNECWYQSSGKWETKQVPPGSEIIGLACNTTSLSFSIPHLAFLLWSPRVTYDKHALVPYSTALASRQAQIGKQEVEIQVTREISYKSELRKSQRLSEKLSQQEFNLESLKI